MQALVAKGDKLDNNNLKQQAAMPLSSFLRFDPWTDQVITMHSAFEPILSAADKMPFEVEPVYLKLSYYKAPAAAGGCSARCRCVLPVAPDRRCSSGGCHTGSRGRSCRTPPTQ
jgi:hypothetical protein